VKVNKNMIELSQNKTNQEPLSKEIVQLNHIQGETFFMIDPEGGTIEFKKTADRTIVFTRDDKGKVVGIENRENGTKLYHISSDSTGLPSSHEIRTDNTEVVYFYDEEGRVQHFVELKPNGDRISTIISKDGSLYSINQKQIGGIVFQAWHRTNEPKEGMIWLHPDGEVSTHGDIVILHELKAKFPKFLDGVTV